MAWTDAVGHDPLPWLLDPGTPAVRAAALVRLLDRPSDDPDVLVARTAAMAAPPIADILAAQHAEGWWARPGPGYAPKYVGTVWQLIFLDQLGADPADERIQRASDYVLAHTAATTGGMGAGGSSAERPPAPSTVLHCLTGNLVAALIGFGRLDDARLQGALDWSAAAITGEGIDRYYASGTSGPGFACGANAGQPCAWGAIKQLRGLSRVPPERRSAAVRRAIEAGVSFLLSRDPLAADYPMAPPNTRPSRSWFRLGFPSAYVTDVLQNLEVLADLGHARDSRVADAMEWLLGQRTADGVWLNRYAYNGKTTVDIERHGQPSKWVTLRACTVLKAAYG